MNYRFKLKKYLLKIKIAKTAKDCDCKRKTFINIIWWEKTERAASIFQQNLTQSVLQNIF
jgi:hypothetical protein